MREELRSRSCVATAVLTLLLAGCSTPTEITSTWKDPSYAAGPMKNIVVFGGRLDATNRNALEDGFASALSARGVHATPSYTLFPGDLPASNDAQIALQKAGVDGILVASMRGVSEQSTYVAGTAYGGPFWGGYYGPGWGGAWDPGYVVTDQFVKFETSLWSPNGDGKMVWSAVTQTENPSSGKDFVSSLTKIVVPALAKAGFLPGPQEGKPVSEARPNP
jgi:hypothetical protein